VILYLLAKNERALEMSILSRIFGKKPFSVGDDVLIDVLPDTGEVKTTEVGGKHQCIRDHNGDVGEYHKSSLHKIPAKIRKVNVGFVRLIVSERRNHVDQVFYFGGEGRPMGGRIRE